VGKKKCCGRMAATDGKSWKEIYKIRVTLNE
jgi:hypothetical protein